MSINRYWNSGQCSGRAFVPITYSRHLLRNEVSVDESRAAVNKDFFN